MPWNVIDSHKNFSVLLTPRESCLLPLFRWRKVLSLFWNRIKGKPCLFLLPLDWSHQQHTSCKDSPITRCRVTERKLCIKLCPSLSPKFGWMDSRGRVKVGSSCDRGESGIMGKRQVSHLTVSHSTFSPWSSATWKLVYFQSLPNSSLLL